MNGLDCLFSCRPSLALVSSGPQQVREMLEINTLKTASWPRSTHINIYVVGCQQETHQIIGSSE